MYAAKVSVRPSVDIFRYHGISPALKYMVITRKRYQNCLCHISFLVTRYPASAETNTMRAVPIKVLRKVTKTEVHKSFTLPIWI